MADNLSPEDRRKCMTSVRNKDTDLEVLVRSRLHRLGLRFRKHVKALPGTPDVVFPRAKVAVFVDGDFWHGYRFRTWRHKVAEFWQAKIEKNRRRDAQNFRRLRGMGWKVIRLWKHELQKDPDGCIERIVITVRPARAAISAERPDPSGAG
jgi:DNA mismatch endonuclease (patch repair protein)